MAKYPPLLPQTRWVFMVLRIIGALVLIASVWIGWFHYDDGETLTGMRVLGGGLSFAIATWMSPYSLWFPVFLGIPILIYPLTGGAGILFLLITVVAVLWLLWRRKQPTSIDPAGVRRVADEAVMPHAVKFVEEFESQGWTRSGAVAADLGAMEITLAVILASDQKTYAEVTDVVIALTSVFTEGRTLVTRNSATSPMSEWVLANDLRGANPASLIKCHQEVLEILASMGRTPLDLHPVGLIDFVVEQEKISIETTAGFKPGLANTGKGSGRIDRSDESMERIRQWQWAEGPDLSHHLGQSD